MRIGVLGLGKLGLPCAEVIAETHQVTGYDIRQDISTKSSLICATEIEKAVLNQDLILVAVPTPHEKEYDGSQPLAGRPLKEFDYKAVEDVLARIHQLSPQSTVVLISTVLPGTVRRQLAPLLPQGQLIYNPYFIAMGSVKEDFVEPEMLPIGTKDGSAQGTEKLFELYRSLMKNPPIVLGTWEEAEAIKIFYNTFISFKLSFVNMIQDVAQKIGHMNVDVVTHSLAKSHKRIISPAYMMAGMGDGGPCHPRDNIALREMAQRLELGYDLFAAIVESREVQAKNLARYLAGFQRPVCILGVSFKPGVGLTDGSYALLVSHYLKEMGLQVSFYDPAAECFEKPQSSQTCLLSHPYNYWEDLEFPKGCVIVDPWRTAPTLAHCQVYPYGNTR